MNAYDKDPRVMMKDESGDLISVDLTGQGFDKPGLVWLRFGSFWRASREQGHYRDYDTADEAIHSLIGEPQ